jgi:hypothetical protein
VFRGKAKTWRGLIKLMAEKHWGSFEEMVAHVFREDWVYLFTGKKVGEMTIKDKEDLANDLHSVANKIESDNDTA